MNGRAQIICLPIRCARILEYQVRIGGQLSRRETHTYTTAHQRIFPAQQALVTCRVEASTPTSTICRSAVTLSTERPGRFKQFIKKIGWLDVSKSKLMRSGYYLYAKTCERKVTEEFFKVCDLPDTFYSWFLVTELHVWLLAVRLMAEGDEGRFVRNSMIEALWLDTDTRSKKLGATSLSIRQEQIQMIASSFQVALFDYDEGLMSDDKVLASALWRRLFSKTCDDPERLECVVHYVRRQMALLDSLSREEILLNYQVTWVPLLEPDS